MSELLKLSLKWSSGKLAAFVGIFALSQIFSLLWLSSIIVFLSGSAFLVYSISNDKIFFEIYQKILTIDDPQIGFIVFFTITLGIFIFQAILNQWVQNDKFSIRQALKNFPLVTSICISGVSALLFDYLINAKVVFSYELLIIAILMLSFFMLLPFMNNENLNFFKAIIEIRKRNKENNNIFTSIFVYSFIIIMACPFIINVFFNFFMNTPAVVMGFLGSVLWFMLISIIIVGISLAYKSLKKEAVVTTKGFKYHILFPALFGIGLLLFASTDFYITQNLKDVIKSKEPEMENKIKIQKEYIFRRSVLRGTPVKGNGADAYLQIIGKKGLEPANIKPGETPFYKDEKNVTAFSEDIYKIRVKDSGELKSDKSIINKYMYLVNKVQYAQQHEYVKFPFTFDIYASLPNFITAQNVTRVMSISTIDSLSHGNTTEGLQMFADTLRFAQDVGNSGTLIGSMVGVVMAKTAVENVYPYIFTEKMTLKDYKTIIDNLTSIINPFIDIKNALTNELLTSQSLFFTNSRSWLGVFVSDGQKFENLFTEYFFKPAAVKAIPAFEKFNNYTMQLIDLPSYKKKEIEQLNEAMTKISNGNFLLDMMLPNYTGVNLRIAKANAVNYGLYIRCGIESYFMTNKKYPDNLNMLVPQFLSGIPSDPFSGKDYIYKKNAKSYRLYSLGENLQDDNGNGELYNKNKEHCDIVFKN